MAKHNWDVIRAEYVEAESEQVRPTLEQLAAKYKISPSHLRERAGAKKENWRLQADRYLQEVQAKRQEKKSTALAGSLAEWDSKCFMVAQGMLEQVFLQIKASHENFKTTGEAMSGKKLDDLSKALNRLQTIGRTALGEQSQVNLKLDTSALTEEQLQRIAAGEDPRNVI